MRTPTWIASGALAFLVCGPTPGYAQKVGKLDEFKAANAPVEQSPTAPPLFRSSTPPGRSDVYVYEQKPIQGRPVLVPPEQAQSIIDRFKSAYPKMGSPRLLIYVNRELVDEKSGLKMIARNEKTEIRSNTKKDGKNADTQGNERVVSENRYSNTERTAPSLADKQTVRDVERLFGRPLRMAKAKLADQRVATQLLPSGSFESLGLDGEQARKDRAALAKIADVVVEILISSREVQVNSLSGVQTYAVPDIQATAIKLSDAAILGQASSADLTGGAPSPSFARSFGVHEITEATALALMEDMLTGFEDPPPANPQLGTP